LASKLRYNVAVLQLKGGARMEGTPAAAVKIYFAPFVKTQMKGNV